MDVALAYPAVASARIARLRSEAQSAVDGLGTREWLEISAFCFSAAVIGTAQTKVTGLLRLGRYAGRKTRTTIASLRANGVVATAQAENIAAARVSSSCIRSIRLWIERFMSLPVEERQNLLVGTALTIAVGYLVAGGADAEGGMADLDLLLGVGFHRNAFSHTILAPLAAETGLRFAAALIARLDSRLPEQHDPVWDALLAASERVFEASVVGVCLGTVVHLLNDVGTPWAGTKPIIGLPMSLSMVGHQALLGANSSAAAVMAVLTRVGENGSTQSADSVRGDCGRRRRVSPPTPAHVHCL